jgi:hypothetical protein
MSELIRCPKRNPPGPVGRGVLGSSAIRVRPLFPDAETDVSIYGPACDAVHHEWVHVCRSVPRLRRLRNAPYDLSKATAQARRNGIGSQSPA